MPDATISEFEREYSDRGVNSATKDTYKGRDCIVAHVDDADAFDAETLPVGWHGHAVLIEDGTHTREARGPLV
jgi:hypothetical protein